MFLEPTIARQVLEPGEDGSEAWHSERAKGIGGSEILACSGGDEYTSPHRLWLSKIQPFVTKPNPAMTHGKIMEPVVKRLFTDETGIEVAETGMWARLDADHHRCNPDGFTSDGGGIEVKTTKEFAHDGSHNAVAWRQGPTNRALAQAQWCMHVTGAEHWWVVCWIYGHPLFVHRVDRDQDIIDLFANDADDMWEYVTIGLPPPMVPMDSSVRFQSDLASAYSSPVEASIEDDLLEPLADERKRLSAAKYQLDEALREIDAKIKLTLGNATVGTVNGNPVVTWKPRSDGTRVLSVK